MKSNLEAKIEECIYCNGVGKVKLKGNVLECPKCYDDRMKLKKYKEANIPQGYYDFTPEDIKSGMTVNLDYLDGTVKEVNYKTLYKEYVNKTEKVFSEGNGLYCHGPNGSGKSTFAFLIGKDTLDNTDYSVKCFNHLSLIKNFQRSWGTDNESYFKQKLFEDFEETDLLIIDDFLYQEHNSDWARELTSEMLKIRVDNNLPVIFTSNYNIDQIAKIIDKNKVTQSSQSIISKILGVIESVVEFENQNFRLNNVSKNSVLFNE